ncbi:cytochrome P450 4C1-like [Cotesia glomerata]|nr:cytochrome P450 4C1-like [Cotesia glomerata]
MESTSQLIMSTFNRRVLEKFIDAMNKQCEILVKIMEPEIDKDEFDIFNYISLCTIDIVCETVMGVPSNEQIKKNSAYPAAFEKIMKILYQRMIELWLHPNVIFNATKLAKDQKECIKSLHKHTNDIIEKKLEQYSKQMNEDAVTQIGFQRKAFLDSFTELLLEGTKLTIEEFREEVENIMFAGYDTTTTVNSFVILMLAIFPKIQEKCYEELVEIFGDKINGGRQIENEDLDRMKYLGRVIKETMRLFPIAPLLIRQVNGDLDIGGGYTLPKGSTVFLAIWKLHRSADIWDDPLYFNPDRFLPEQVSKRHPYAYIPFSAGPRNCIGLKYAMMSMKILLATLLRNYIFMKDKHVNIEDIEIKAEVFLKTINPITIKIKRRTNTFES